MNLNIKSNKKVYKYNKFFILFMGITIFLLVQYNLIDSIEVIMIMLIAVLILIIEECLIRIKVKNTECIKCREGYALSIEAMNGAIWKWDDDKNSLFISGKIKNELGIKKENITLEEWYRYVDDSECDRVRNYFNNICLNRMCLESNIKYRIKAKDGQLIHIDYTGKGTIKDKVYSLSGVITDVSNEKKAEQKIHFMNYYDDITGIPNRKMFTEIFKELINDNLSCGTKLGLIFYDIDNFKSINDTYGHEVGDEILLKLSERVNKELDGRHTFARFGGDEFVIAFSRVHDENEIRELLNKLLVSVRKPIEVNNKSIYCSISLGVSMYPRDADNLDILLKTADMAMHKAKEEGKNRFRFFDVDILTLLRRQYDIEKALRTSIEKKEIFMVFQPKISIKGEKVNGFEALVRWVSQELGFVSPAEFIPIAENTGFIVELGKYIIEESFKKCRELYESSDNKFHIAINISDIQLREEGFIDFVSALLNKYNIPPEYIEFEITEGVIMQSVSRNIELLLNLKKLGVSIALDDFGTGYSSLSYLKRLPIDVLKIDKSFVDGIGVDEKSEYIAESIIKLSHSLDLKVVAEGVETKEQLGYLDKMKCDIAQGYYFSKPEKFEIIKEMI